MPPQDRPRTTSCWDTIAAGTAGSPIRTPCGWVHAGGLGTISLPSQTQCSRGRCRCFAASRAAPRQLTMSQASPTLLLDIHAYLSRVKSEIATARIGPKPAPQPPQAYDENGILREYGDASCPMGSVPLPTHYNAPQSVWLGWTLPQAVLTSAELLEGMEARRQVTGGPCSRPAMSPSHRHLGWSSQTEASFAGKLTSCAAIRGRYESGHDTVVL